jgi:hypothetical protein
MRLRDAMQRAMALVGDEQGKGGHVGFLARVCREYPLESRNLLPLVTPDRPYFALLAPTDKALSINRRLQLATLATRQRHSRRLQCTRICRETSAFFTHPEIPRFHFWVNARLPSLPRLRASWPATPQTRQTCFCGRFRLATTAFNAMPLAAAVNGLSQPPSKEAEETTYGVGRISRRTWLTETRLHGWACETRTQKRRRKLSL